MGIRYKIDVLAALKEAGYNTNRLKLDRILSDSVVQYLREGKIVSAKNLGILCRVLNMQPGDILEYVDHE